MHAAADFGLSTTDAVLLARGDVVARTSRLRPGPASAELLASLIAGLTDDRSGAGSALASIAVTGGRSRELPDELGGTPVIKVDEPAAAGRGGLALSGLRRALVVSCGTGTAMVAADLDARQYHHVAGTPVGGGTLEGLGSRLLGEARAERICDLAAGGRAAAVDTTLAEVLGGGLGHLPPTATAVSFGKLAHLDEEPERADLAAALTTLIAQTIAFIALGAARNAGLERVVLIGRLAGAEVISRMIAAVFAVYAFPTAPMTPAGAGYDPGHAVALGAALLTAEADR